MAELFQKIESQIDDITQLYDLAEKAYPYENIKPERSLNENEYRQ